MDKRLVIKIGGEAGQGINVAGDLLARSLKRAGYHVFNYREYPSLIMGGNSSSQVDVGTEPISAPNSHCDLLVCLSRKAVNEYLDSLNPGGVMLHCLDHLEYTPEQHDLIAKKSLHVEFVDAFKMATDIGQNRLLANIIFLGMIWRYLGLDPAIIRGEVEYQFSDKPKILGYDLESIDQGYALTSVESSIKPLPAQPKSNWQKSLYIKGNEAVGIGAVAAGVRLYLGYPMTPSSAILSYMSNTSHATGIVVKQAEDEITAAQMAIGAMFAGTRALVATSGGGFDLMTETLSLSGMTETPFVCVIGQRPGPSTGLPTWTSASDLNLAIYAGHGEFPRCVLAASDPTSAYLLTQEAFNLAEEYQIPVLILTDKEMAESAFNCEPLPAPMGVRRGLVAHSQLESMTPSDRYKITKSGISPRWLPGVKAATYVANSDEHLPDGTVTEAAKESAEMYDKRMRKETTLNAELPEPIMYGNKQSDTVLIGWGSVKSSVMDAFAESDSKLAYLHYEYMYPLRTDVFKRLHKQGKRLIMIENNYRGQLADLLTQQTGILLTERWLKYDGRPFFVDEIIDKLKKL